MCVAHISDDEEAKALSGIKMLPKGEMKENLMETFLQTMLKNQGSTSTPTSKGIVSRALFVDTPYQKNTKSFQRNHQPDKQRVLTINEELKNMKKEINKIKAQFAKLELGVQ